MYQDHDPLESALNSMRSDRWTGKPFDPQLEEKLMQEFAKNPNGRRFARVPTWLLAATGVLLVGGAATGTVALVRSWLVTVQIGDQQYQFQTDANGEGNIQVQTEDGKTANVSVKRVEGDNGTEETNVNVDVSDANNNTQNQKVMKIVHGNGSGPALKNNATEADLAETKPAVTWSAANGKSYAVHLVSAGAGTPYTLYLVTTDADGTRNIARVTQLPGQLNIGTDPEVAHEANGMIKLTFRNEATGNVNVMKFKVADTGSAGESELPANGHIQIDPAAGQIRINGDKPDED